ncbi:hypothetical protein MDAP_002708 [Mitosporidium daphniae]
MKKLIVGICTPLGLSSIISECIHVSTTLLEQGYKGRFSKCIPPASIYLVMRREGKSVPLGHLSSVANVPISAFVKCAQKFKPLFNTRLDTSVSVCPCANLFEVYLNQIITGSEIHFCSTLPSIQLLLPMIKSLFDLIYTHSFLSQGRKPEIFALALVFIALYAYLTFPSELHDLCTKACKLNLVTKRRVLLCFDEISNFLVKSFSILKVHTHHVDPYHFLVYLPSLLKFVPLVSYCLLHQATAASPKKESNPSLSLCSRIEMAQEWVSNLCSNPSPVALVSNGSLATGPSCSSPPDYTDVQIRYLLLNNVTPSTISNLTIAGIDSLASSFKANMPF